ncbi:MAG: hypothetical protein H7124_13350 [Phycisphaerales bacterium]|nr:hypothetical protein [Hyphomonadaceae bacterium]
MRPIRTALAAFAVLCAAVTPAAASPTEVARAIPGAQQVGEARYQLLTVTLFEAELWTGTGDFSWNTPFALALTYERSARASTLINRSISEMSQRGAGTARSLAPLRAQLAACFPNIARGDRVTGVSTGPNTARFYYNGAQRCEIEWPGFRRSFFGIWLDGRDGQAAAFSARLRGEG